MKILRTSLSFSGDLAERIEKIPLGLRSKLSQIIMERILDAVEMGGPTVLAIILSGQFEIVSQIEAQTGEYRRQPA